ncbi:MAG: NAD(P)-dependent alcohol dehydrogenase, partial [Pseudomonadota bacterium]
HVELFKGLIQQGFIGGVSLVDVKWLPLQGAVCEDATGYLRGVEIAEDELLVRVHAAEATKSDCEMRSFKHNVKWFALPLRLALGVRGPRQPVPGMYFAGEVAEVGASVTGFAQGDAVFGCTGMGRGAYAEYVKLPARAALAAKPEAMSYADAAAVPLGGLNALHFMQQAQLRRGEEILINGAGGSIGVHAVQIARAMGARVTAVDCARKADLVTAYGAARFIDYERENFTEARQRYDVIFDMVPGSSVRRCTKLLNSGGRYLAGNPRLRTMLGCLWLNRHRDKMASFAFAPETRGALAKLAGMANRGELTSIVDTVYPMADAVTAHRRVDEEDRLGAIVIDMTA